MPNANNRKGNPVTNPSSVPWACEKNDVAYVMGQARQQNTDTHSHTLSQGYTQIHMWKRRWKI